MKPSFFVFDTNALISAFLIKHSISDQAFRKAIATGVLAISDASLSEFLEVLWRPKFDKYFSTHERVEVVLEVEKYTSTFSIAERITDSKDPEDNMFLELAIASQATCIITGDPHLLTLHPFRAYPFFRLLISCRSFECSFQIVFESHIYQMFDIAYLNSIPLGAHRIS